MGDRSQGSQQKGSGQYTFFQRLFALLFGTDDPEREKRRQLKTLATELTRQKHKFYKPRSGEALGALAKFFFDIYRVVGPAQTLLQGGESSNALKLAVIERFHTEDQRAMRERFTEASIREAAKRLQPKQLVAEVKNAMSTYLAGFTSTTVRAINDVYTLIQQLVAFVRFDFYFTLRKFDSNMQEGNFLTPVRPGSINAEYISDDLKDFLEVLMGLDYDGDWDTALAVIAEYRGVEVISPGPWKKLLASLSSVARSGVLVQIVQHVDEDPRFRPVINEERYHIVESHLNIIKTQVEALMQKLIHEMKGQKVQQMVQAVFGDSDVQRTKHYTEKMNAEFTKRMVAGFAHTEAFNYLTLFLLDYFNVDVRVLISELFIVRATWSDNTVSSQLSEAFYGALNNAEAVEEFDQSLGDDGELGTKVRKASGPVKQKDPSAVRLLRQVVHDIDERAMNLITESASNLITVGRIIKNLIGDHDKPTPEIIINWRELETMAGNPLKPQLTAIYKKIYHFIQLMQYYVSK